MSTSCQAGDVNECVLCRGLCPSSEALITCPAPPTLAPSSSSITLHLPNPCSLPSVPPLRPSEPSSPQSPFTSLTPSLSPQSCPFTSPPPFIVHSYTHFTSTSLFSVPSPPLHTHGHLSLCPLLIPLPPCPHVSLPPFSTPPHPHPCREGYITDLHANVCLA